jgi:hypothetical protein
LDKAVLRIAGECFRIEHAGRRGHGETLARTKMRLNLSFTDAKHL